MDNGRKFEVFDEKKSHEYTINIDEGEKYSLSYSENEIWSEGTKGEKAAELTDDGNGFELTLFRKSVHGIEKKETIRIDYAEAAHIRLLLGIENKLSRESEFSIIESTDMIKV
jgi:hypothetical protein